MKTSKNPCANDSVLICESLETRWMLSAVDVIAAGTTGQEALELRIDGVTVQSWSDLGNGAYSDSFVTRRYDSTSTITP